MSREGGTGEGWSICRILLGEMLKWEGFTVLLVLGVTQALQMRSRTSSGLIPDLALSELDLLKSQGLL